MCSLETLGTIPTSLLVFVENVFTSLVLKKGKLMWGKSVKTYFIAVYFRQLVTDKGLTQLLVTGIYVHHTHQARA